MSFEKLAIKGSHERRGSGPGSLEGLPGVFFVLFGDTLGESMGSPGSGVGSLGVGVFGGLFGSGDGSLECIGLSNGPQGSGVGSLGVGVFGGSCGSLVGDGVEALGVDLGSPGGGGVRALGGGVPVGGVSSLAGDLRGGVGVGSLRGGVGSLGE